MRRTILICLAMSLLMAAPLWAADGDIKNHC